MNCINEMLRIMQGDAYDVGVTVLDTEGKIIDESAVLDVEITVGKISKTYTGGDVYFAEDEWHFPLTEGESFSLSGFVPFQVRVKFNSGEVAGISLGSIAVTVSVSKEEL